jgi:hypothetical protein
MRRLLTRRFLSTLLSAGIFVLAAASMMSSQPTTPAASLVPPRVTRLAEAPGPADTGDDRTPIDLDLTIAADACDGRWQP